MGRRAPADAEPWHAASTRVPASLWKDLNWLADIGEATSATNALIKGAEMLVQWHKARVAGELTPENVQKWHAEYAEAKTAEEKEAWACRLTRSQLDEITALIQLAEINATKEARKKVRVRYQDPHPARQRPTVF